MKLTDAEIVKAFGSLFKKLLDVKYDLKITQKEFKALNSVNSLINRQKAEIERLINIYSEKCIENKKIEWNAINKFIEKAKEKQEFLVGEDNKYKGYVSIKDLEILKNCD